jgi:hypothetical protein
MLPEPRQNEPRIIKDIQMHFGTFGKGTMSIDGNAIDIDPNDQENPEKRVKEIILQTFVYDHGGEEITHVYVKNSGSKRFDYRGKTKDLLRELFVNSSGFMRPTQMVVQDYLDKKNDRKMTYGEKFFGSLKKYCEGHGISYNAFM